VTRRRRLRYGPGTTAIVTGGGGGIGTALAAELARRGATVVVADVDGAAARAERRRAVEGSSPRA
jgi:NAD(P)-dependent dehydrogenase (short-subunit alcohol dehydrogenase family)